MTRLTLVAFVLLTGFFYITGKPVDENGIIINTYADLAKQKVEAGLISTNLLPKLTSSDQYGSFKKHAVLRGGDDLVAKTDQGANPQIPVRNPRRLAAAAPRFDTPSSASASTPMLATVKTVSLSGNTNQRFGQARNKTTGATIKPLAESYRQRYVKTKKPVLGPRLTAVLLKRELRRVGCYNGNITSKWDNNARTAVQNFNTNAGTSITAGTPTVATLEHLQQITSIVWRYETDGYRSCQDCSCQDRPCWCFTTKSSEKTHGLAHESQTAENIIPLLPDDQLISYL